MALVAAGVGSACGDAAGEPNRVRCELQGDEHLVVVQDASLHVNRPATRRVGTSVSDNLTNGYSL